MLTGCFRCCCRYSYHSNGGVPPDPYDTRPVPDDPYGSRPVPQDPYDTRPVPQDPYDVEPDDRYYPGRNARGPRRLSPARGGGDRAARGGGDRAAHGGGDRAARGGGDRAARRDLSPGIPRSPRGGSPMPRSRELSPVRYQPAVGPPANRAMSPPPELRNSYFPNKGLPNYLEGGGDVYRAGGGDVYGAGDVYDARLVGRGGSRGGGGGPKYTASSLGLTDRGGPSGPPPGGAGNLPRNPSARDEGYRSMDRVDTRRPLSGQYYDNPYAPSMDRMNRDPVQSMPNVGYPPQGPGYKRDKPRRAYDEMPAPDYAVRGGGGFDYLP